MTAKLKKKRSFSIKEQKLIRVRKNASPSKGEVAVQKVLKESGLTFYQEFYFNDLAVREKEKLLFFDFYIPSYKVAIEFDGEQHYTREFKGKAIVNGAAHYFMKNAFCLKNGIKMLRIKYTDIDKVENIILNFFDKHYPA